MKKLFFVLLLLPLLCFSQAASKVNNSQNVSTTIYNPTVLLGCQPLPSGLFEVYVKDDIRWETYNINNFNSSVSSIGNTLYKPISYSPTYSEIVAGLGYVPANSVSINPTIVETDPTVGNHIKSITTTNIANWNTSFGWGNHASVGYLTASSINTLSNKSGNISQWTNDSGYITSVTSSLGYTPVPTSRILTINGSSQDLSTDRIWNVGDLVSTNTYSNPSWITSLAQSKITYTGTINQYIRGDGSIAIFPSLFSGDYNDLVNKPNLNLYYLASNPNNYITTAGVTSAVINSALGYTPYNGATNPNGYLSSINSSQIISALGYTPYNGTTNPSGFLTSYTETDPLFDTKFSAKTTTNLTEGANLYFTTARFNSNFSLKTTADLAEGTNFYFTNSRARTAISLTTTGTSGVATYNNSTGVLNIPNYTPTIPTINNNVSRTLNSNYTISSTQNARVSYSINVNWSITAVLSTAATAFLEYSTNGGSSWITVNQISNNVNLGLALSGTTDLNLSGEIPLNALVRLRTTTTNATITYVRGQEVLY